MSLITCLHPNCDKPMSRGRYCCPRHWHQLNYDLQRRLSRAKSAEDLGSARLEAVSWLEDRMIGPHEIVRCRGADCGADIVWLQGIRRDGSAYNMAVDADTVEDTDEEFDRLRHAVHWENCPNADDFRRGPR